jgi:hypothetical protein
MVGGSRTFQISFPVETRGVLCDIESYLDTSENEGVMSWKMLSREARPRKAHEDI